MVRRPVAPPVGPGPTKPARGDIWLVSLDPTVGAEIQKTRPCVIISPPEMLEHLRTILVAPMTTAGHPAPFRVAVRFEAKPGLILLDQIRSLDRQRLIRRLGALDPRTRTLVLHGLQDTFAP